MQNNLIRGKPNYTHQERIMARVKKAQVHICQKCKQSYVVHCHFIKIVEASAFIKKQFNYLFQELGKQFEIANTERQVLFSRKASISYYQFSQP